jgi:hypothetical protein
MPTVQLTCEHCGRQFSRCISPSSKGQLHWYCTIKCRAAHQKISLEDRFWAGVGKKTERGCVLWNGPISENGYGAIGYRLKGREGGHFCFAHRVSYEFFRGTIPEDKIILHSCDVRRCLNPYHMSLGTRTENAADRDAKGRTTKGSDQAWSKLDEQKIVDILRKYRRGERNKPQLAKDYEVSLACIIKVTNRETWKHVYAPLRPGERIALPLILNRRRLFAMHSVRRRKIKQPIKRDALPIHDGDAINERNVQIRNCVQCGDPFRVKRWKSDFCSRRCRFAANRGSMESVFWNGIGRKTGAGCIEWNGYVNPAGYGVFSFGILGQVSAHRFSYELFCGDILRGGVVRHACHNRLCVSPLHLKTGTMRDNADDMVTGGRSCVGEKNPGVKLDSAKVMDIRRRHAAGESQVSLAREFDVKQACISSIVLGKTWKHLRHPLARIPLPTCSTPMA